MARARSFGNVRTLHGGRYQVRYWHLGKQIPANTRSRRASMRGAGSPHSRRARSGALWVEHNTSKIPFGNFAPQRSEARDAAGLGHVLRYHGDAETATSGASFQDAMTIVGHASSAASLHFLKTTERCGREITNAGGRRVDM